MHHAILGAGGVGGMIGACLARAGEAVTLVVRPETLAAHPSQLELESPFGNWRGEVAWASTVPPTDVLWLTVKATQLDASLRSIVDPSSFRTLVPLLNGIDHLPLLCEKYGADRVIPATIAGEFERVSIGHIAHRSSFARLHLSSKGRKLLNSVADQFEGIGFVCKFFDDETTLMWSKLVFLAPIALTTSAFGRTIGEVVADPQSRDQLRLCVREACAAAQAEGAQVNADAIIKMVESLPPGMRSSMQKDVENGRQPELDAIGGAILRAAQRHRLSTPATEALIAQVERRRAEARRAS